MQPILSFRSNCSNECPHLLAHSTTPIPSPLPLNCFPLQSSLPIKVAKRHTTVVSWWPLMGFHEFEALLLPVLGWSSRTSRDNVLDNSSTWIAAIEPFSPCWHRCPQNNSPRQPSVKGPNPPFMLRTQLVYPCPEGSHTRVKHLGCLNERQPHSTKEWRSRLVAGRGCVVPP